MKQSIVIAALAVLFVMNATAKGQETEKAKYAQKVKKEFLFAWNNYKKYAWGHDELAPLTKSYHDWYAQSLMLTPVESYDTMVLMGLKKEAEEDKAFILDSLSFDKDFIFHEEMGVGHWGLIRKPSPDNKNPNRYGTFKDAFRHDMEFVYGTHGTKAENEWAFDKTRSDAEYFWYQGNGSVEVVSDRDFNPTADPNRNIILYGNERTNSAWNEVLSDSPVTVSEGELTFGNRAMEGKDYACFMVRPRKGSAIASVGVVSGTGIKGMRLTYIVPYLQPWFSLPDLAIMNTSVFTDGGSGARHNGYYGHKNGGQLGFGAEGGVKIAGFFGLDWSLKNGEFVEQK